MIGEEIDFDALEAKGHNLTLVAPLHAGRSCYVCENCGAFVLVKANVIAIWYHPHRSNDSCDPAREGGRALYDQLRALDLRELEKIRNLDVV